MTKRKELHKYPQEYYDLFKAAHEREVRVPYETRGRAVTVRVDLYNFRVAVREALRANPQSEHLQETLVFVEGIELSVQRSTLILRKKEPDHIQEIRESIGSGNTSSSPTES